MNSTSCRKWQVLIQLTQIAFRSVVLHVRHLRGMKIKAKRGLINDERRKVPNELPVEVVHRKASVARNFVETSATVDSFFHGIMIIKDVIVFESRVNTRC